ncbi:glutathione synthase [Lautropia mirabilis]|jgi:glutathione synthase|uniref:glutathione synthase n=1 Tax=Lautropia mirabilis TaxID=47671 RepID=UPI000F0F11DB|nr:glutathione synthase [Lautropia mirabilis]MBF1234526.1 glutathione synthase [Lautropia mirabilis]MDC6094376.1 glutathione synthase [Lautropia mirabilis]RKW46991.1 MAG: glutathione synthase [Lautropia sp.]
MDILFILDPFDSLKPKKETSIAMMRAAVARGHRVFGCLQGDISLDQGKVTARVTPLELTGELSPWYKAAEVRTEPLSAFDAVLMRKDPPFDMEYVYSTYMLERAVEQGARVYNNPAAIRDHNEKFSITAYPQLTTDVMVTRDPARLREFVARHGEAVLKLLDGMGGASIFRARQDDPNLSVILETMNRFGTRTVMAQRYLPAIAQGDKRILLIDGEVVPHALARIPQAGEARGNMAAGGKPVAQPLSARDEEIARYLGPRLAAKGLFLVGLDVIGDSLTEINVTSPTGFMEITAQTGFDVPDFFIAQLEKRVAADRSAAGA